MYIQYVYNIYHHLILKHPATTDPLRTPILKQQRRLFPKAQATSRGPSYWSGPHEEL